MEEEERQVPDLRLGDKQQVREQKIEIPLKINGKDAKVEIKKLSTGERNKIRSDCTKTKILGGQPNITVNDSEIQERILAACIVTAPFDSSLNGIKLLPAEVSDYLFEEYTEFAEPTDKKKD